MDRMRRATVRERELIIQEAILSKLHHHPRRVTAEAEHRRAEEVLGPGADLPLFNDLDIAFTSSQNKPRCRVPNAIQQAQLSAEKLLKQVGGALSTQLHCKMFEEESNRPTRHHINDLLALHVGRTIQSEANQTLLANDAQHFVHHRLIFCPHQFASKCL
ncbi:unnamed protein product [Sphagnum tenellum]